jgi:hypothetical protein
LGTAIKELFGPGRFEAILGLLIKRNGLWYLDTNKFQIWNTYNLPAQTDKANEAAQKSRTASVLA